MATNDIQYQDRRGVYLRVKADDFVKAPFDVVQLNREWGVEPSYIIPQWTSESFPMTNDMTALDDDWWQAREQGYHSLDFVVAELHELGGSGEGWEGVHLFGPV